MIAVNNTFSLNEDDIRESFIHASGPGGQNVNKVATAVQLKYDTSVAEELSVNVYKRLKQLSGGRMTKDGVIVITAKRYRTRERNREDALERLMTLLRRAFVKPKPRKKRKPSAASKERRLQAKRKQSEQKALRQKLN